MSKINLYHISKGKINTIMNLTLLARISGRITCKYIVMCQI